MVSPRAPVGMRVRDSPSTDDEANPAARRVKKEPTNIARTAEGASKSEA